MNKTTSTRPNFFLLLSLHPDDPWNEKHYQKALQEKSEQWSSASQGISKKALAAQVHLALIPQIRAVMENPTARQVEEVAARKILAQKQHLEREQFEKQVALLNMKESADTTEVEKFIADFKHVVSPAEIQRRITVKIRPGTGNTQSLPKLLDRSLTKNITDRLDILQLKTLYELLQVSPQAETPALFQASEALYTRLVRLHPSVETTVKMELSGFAMTIFASEEMRAQYDETLRLQTLHNLLKDLDASMERATRKELYPRQILFYLTNARNAGCQVSTALDQLKAHAQQQSWFLILPTNEQLNALSDPAPQEDSTPPPVLVTPPVSAAPPTPASAVSLTPLTTSHAARPAAPQSAPAPTPQPTSTSLPAVQATADILYQDEEAEDIHDLQYQILRSSIRLYWKWPQHCQAVYLFAKASQDAAQTPASTPAQSRSATTTRLVSRAEYDRLGYYDLSGDWDHHYLIHVSAISERDGKQIIARGVQISAHLYRTILTYEVQLSLFPLRKRMLYLKTVTPTPLPTLLVVSKSGTVPLGKGDGELFHRFSARTAENGECCISLPATRLPANSLCKLFLDDDRLYSAITIHHPSEKKLRLS